MRYLLALSLALSLVVSPAIAAEPIREEGSLVFDGIPLVDPAVLARGVPYGNVRSARLVGWRPDGKGILISTRFGETNQLHTVAAPGADRQQVSFFAEPVGGAAYDPARSDGMYVSIDRGGGEAFQIGWFDQSANRVDWLTAEGSRNTSLRVATSGDHLLYTGTARNRTDYDLYQVDQRNAATGRRLVELSGDWSVTDWSDDRARVLLHNVKSATDSTLHLFEVATGTLTPLAPATGPAATADAAFSADGGTVFYLSDEGGEFRTLRAIDLSTRVARTLTPGLTWDVEALTLSPDRRWIAWAVNAGGASEVYLASSARPERATRLTGIPQGVASGLMFDPAGTRLGMSISTASTPSDVYTVETRHPQRTTRWTWSELGGLDPARFVQPQLVTVPSFDGLEVPAWYYPAPGPGPHPVVISIHGGPEGQSRPSFSATNQYLIDQLGTSVLVPNVRGSTGYGRTYTQRDNGMKRLDSVKDIGALLDWIRTRPELDAGRVAVSGGSYGGYMVLASMVAYGERIRCGHDSVGPSNFVTFLENTESYRRDLRRAEYGDERDPEMRAFLNATAPRNQVDKLVRPLLVVQGQNDPRVPMSESRAMVDAVRANGGEVWYLLGRDEGHGFKRKTNRDTQLAVATMFYERCLR